MAIGEHRRCTAKGFCSGYTSVYAYNVNPSEWLQVGYTIYGEGELDYSGDSVSLSGDGLTVSIGAFANDGNGSDSGHVLVYKYLAE